MPVKKADILVVTAHPDDSEFGASGTIAKWINEGKSVVYVVCTNGEKGTEDMTIKPEEMVELRRKEQLAAAKLLGVKDLSQSKLPDAEIVKQIIEGRQDAKGSQKMPPFKDMLTDEEIKELVKVVKSFRK